MDGSGKTVRTYRASLAVSKTMTRFSAKALEYVENDWIALENVKACLRWNRDPFRAARRAAFRRHR